MRPTQATNHSVIINHVDNLFQVELFIDLLLEFNHMEVLLNIGDCIHKVSYLILVLLKAAKGFLLRRIHKAPEGNFLLIELQS